MYYYISVKFLDIFDKKCMKCYKYHMLSISEVTRDLITESLLLEEALSLGIINLTGLARILKMEIEKRLMKPVRIGSIVMSLKRLPKKSFKTTIKYREVFEQIQDISVRSNLVEYTFQNRDDLIEKLALFLRKFGQNRDLFFTTSRGIRETSCIVSKSTQKEIEAIFENNRLVAKTDQLAAITIVHPTEAVSLPGFYYIILKVLAWNNINVIETVSTYTEFTVVLESKDIDKAFSVLKTMIKT